MSKNTIKAPENGFCGAGVKKQEGNCIHLETGILKQDVIFVSLNIMAHKSKGISKSTTSDGFAYLTKRIVVSKAKSAGKAAAKNAMELMGYVVTVKDGWVIKEHQDGKVEQIEKLQTA